MRAVGSSSRYRDGGRRTKNPPVTVFTPRSCLLRLLSSHPTQWLRRDGENIRHPDLCKNGCESRRYCVVVCIRIPGTHIRCVKCLTPSSEYTSSFSGPATSHLAAPPLPRHERQCRTGSYASWVESLNRLEAGSQSWICPRNFGYPGQMIICMRLLLISGWNDCR